MGSMLVQWTLLSGLVYSLRTGLDIHYLHEPHIKCLYKCVNLLGFNHVYPNTFFLKSKYRYRECWSFLMI